MKPPVGMDIREQDTAPARPQALYRWREQLLEALLRGVLVVGLFALVGGGILPAIQLQRPDLLVTYLVAYAALVLVTLMRKLGFALRAATLLFLIYALGALDFSVAGLSGDGRIFLFACVVITAVLFSLWHGIAVLALSLLTMAISGWLLITGQWHIPLEVQANSTNAVDWVSGSAVFLLLGAAVIISTSFLIRSLGRSVKASQDAVRELQAQQENLEQLVRQRTQDLEHRSIQLRLAAEVARDATAARELDDLLDRATDLIQDRFGFHHVGIFLMDELGERAVLQAAAGEAGQQMLEQGYGLKVGEGSIIGEVITTGRPRIARNLGPDAVHFANPLLPAARSEMALPLRLGGRVIGALDVQSQEVAAFDEDDVAVLQTLADQLAVAIENIRLIHEMQQTVRELEMAYGRHTQEAWSTATRGPRPATGYRYQRLGVEPIVEQARLREEARQAWLEGRPVTTVEAEPSLQSSGDGKQSARTVAVPIKFRDQAIGALSVRSASKTLSSRAVPLIEEVANRLALALENSRLFAETQKAAQQMQALYETSRVLSSSLEKEALMHALLEAVYRALDCEYVLISTVEEAAQTIGVRHGIWEGAFDVFPEWIQKAQYPLDHPDILADIYRSGRTEIIGEWDARFNREIWDKFGHERFLRIFMPIKMRDRVLGVVEVSYDKRKRERIDQDDTQMLSAFMDQAAVTLENARLFEEARIHAEELATLNALGQALTTRLNVEEVLDEVYKGASRLLDTHNFYVALYDPDSQTVTFAFDVTEGQVRRPYTARQAGQGLTEYIIHHQQPTLITGNVADHLREMGIELIGRTALSWLGVPLIVGGRVLGVMAVQSYTTPGVYDEHDLDLMTAIASQAAIALQNARLFEETQRRAAQLATAAEVARDATAILDVDQLLDQAVHLISEQFGFYHVAVFLLDEAGEYAVLRAASSEGGRRMLARGHTLRAGEVGIVGHVVGTGEPRIAMDVASDADFFNNPDLPETRSEAALPLKVRGRVIGVLDVQSTQKGAFPADSVAVLQTLADQLATAITNAHLFQEVRADVTRRAFINEVLQAATSSLDLQELLRRAGEAISRQLDMPCAVLEWNPQEESVRTITVHGPTGADVAPAEPLVITPEMHSPLFNAIYSRQLQTISSVGTYARQAAAELIQLLHIVDAVYAPLISRDQVLGLLMVGRQQGHPPLDDGELSFTRIVAANLSVQMENARAYAELQRTTERLKELDRLKSQFLANMSHELRTPLNSIIGFSRVILKGVDGPLTDMQRTDLQAVYDSGQHLLKLINDILDISKIQAGKMEISFEQVDLHEIIESIMATAAALIKDKPVELQQSIPADLPTIPGDARRIQQVFLNLIGNAANFTEKGFIRVEAVATPTEVTISVADSGIGIPADQQQVIFEEFTQVDGSSTRRAGGTGLGLSISRHFVEMHGGRIWVESTLGEGSTFYVTLPVRAAPLVGRVEGAEGGGGVESPLEPDQKLVLCVDDDEGVIMLFRRYLSKRGYRVAGLTNSELVLERARHIRPFAITLDVMMPNKDGWQVIQELKTDPDTRHIPVIMCTIISEKEYGLSLGASDYLVKPILEEDLLAALQRLDRDEGRHRVLVVDDQADSRNLLRRMIESQPGYEVIEAAGGQEAITLVREVQPQIIVLDLMMPDVDGFAVLEAIKADARTRTIPIIVVTAKDLTQGERERLNRRVEALLQKGLFEQAELLADVAAALERIKQKSGDQ